MASNLIPVAVLIGYFQRMLAEHWAYDWSGTETGKVSCAGAFVWAFRQHGISIYHGSNRMARVEVERLIPINVANIMPGMAAFKHHAPGESGYALPDSYKPGGEHYNGDLNDYYHVGLVDEDTTRVLNAQGANTGFVASAIGKGGWSHVAYLSQVDYDGQEEIVYIPAGEQPSTPSKPETPTVELTPEPSYSVAMVYASSGTSVKMRNKPSKTERLYWDIPIGEMVQITGAEKSGFTPIRRGNGQTGWMMTEFLKVDSHPPIDPAPSEKKRSVTIVDLSWDEANVLLAEYPGRSFPGESNG